MAAATMDQPGQPRDAYQGTTPPALAEARTAARLVSVRQCPTTAAVLAVIDDAGTVRLIRATKGDAPELAVLSASDRASVAAAVATMQRQAHQVHQVPGDGA